MSLPDTIFIFVLALIIFGPKKLPEIGRQIGKLVGEFRRASNDFKFQIEEELRQADVLEKRSAPSIARSLSNETATPLEVKAQTADPSENLPVGQRPNIEMLNTAELLPSPEDNSGANGSGRDHAAAASFVSGSLTEILPASGSQARTSVPFAPVEPVNGNGAAAYAQEPSEGPLEPASTQAETAHG